VNTLRSKFAYVADCRRGGAGAILFSFINKPRNPGSLGPLFWEEIEAIPTVRMLFFVTNSKNYKL
jgi:hypothetical protein